MIRIVIVEDETFVRLGMKMCMEEYQVPMTVVGAFGSAEEAERFLDHNAADVLVTDIRLTGMSGLELVRRVKKKNPYMVTVIVSCHEDFTYAREAMELGVDRYILKNEVGEKELPKFIEEQYRLKWKNIPRDILDKGMEYQEEGEAFGEAFLVASVIVRGKGERYNTTRDEISFEILSEILQRLLTNRKLGKSFVRHDKEIICLLNIDKRQELAEKQKDLESFFSDASRNVENYFNRNLFLILSEPFFCQTEVKKYYEQTLGEVWRTFYLESSACIRAGHGEAGALPEVRLKTEVCNVFEDGWYEGEKEKIRRYMRECRRKRVYVKDLKDGVIKYFSELEIYLEHNCRNVSFSDIFSQDELPNYRNIEKYDSAECLEQYLTDCLEAVGQKVLKKREIFDEIREYIGLAFREQMSIHAIADRFHMNTAYFCQYFKKHAGMTCVQYINRLKIEEAKRLLSDPALSSEQVAQRIGLDNCNYFYRLFKKTTGMTAGEYKKMQRRSVEEVIL